MKDNTWVIRRAIKNQIPIWNDEIETQLDDFCRNLLLQAVIDNRLRNPEGHQYTGNLINSIVVILFRKDTCTQSDYYAYDKIGKPPIRREMSAKTVRGGKRKNAIHFRPDWQNTPHSQYTPVVETDESYGQNDARSFAASWSPSTGSEFEICVAYTSEYADWVNIHNKTTGYMQSLTYTKKALRTGLGLKFVKIA